MTVPEAAILRAMSETRGVSSSDLMARLQLTILAFVTDMVPISKQDFAFVRRRKWLRTSAGTAALEKWDATQ